MGRPFIKEISFKISFLISQVQWLGGRNSITPPAASPERCTLRPVRGGVQRCQLVFSFVKAGVANLWTVCGWLDAFSAWFLQETRLVTNSSPFARAAVGHVNIFRVQNDLHCLKCKSRPALDKRVVNV